MMVACLDCGNRKYTEISPLWYTCDKCLKRSYCFSCGDQYLKTQLEHGLCKRCRKHEPIEEVMYYCDGCGEDFPRSHLEYVAKWDGYFCNSCCE